LVNLKANALFETGVSRQGAKKRRSAKNFQFSRPQDFSLFLYHPKMDMMLGGYVFMRQSTKREQLPDPGFIHGRGEIQYHFGVLLSPVKLRESADFFDPLSRGFPPSFFSGGRFDRRHLYTDDRPSQISGLFPG
jgi:hypothetical protein